MMKILAAVLLLAPVLCFANGDDYSGSIKGKDVTVGGGVKFSSTPVGFLSSFQPNNFSLNNGATIFSFISDAPMQIARMQIFMHDSCTIAPADPSLVMDIDCKNRATGQVARLSALCSDMVHASIHTTTVTLNVGYQEIVDCIEGDPGKGDPDGMMYNLLLEYLAR